MEKITNFINQLIIEGVQVIVITDLPEQFEDMDKVDVVGEWNESWEVVDKKVGKNRKMLMLDTLHDDIFELDALEAYVQAGILEDKMFWIKLSDNIITKREAQEIFGQLRHLVIILGGNDFYTSLESLKNKLSDYKHQDFIVGPLSEKLDSDTMFYYRTKALTVILEWPRKIDKLEI